MHLLYQFLDNGKGSLRAQPSNTQNITGSAQHLADRMRGHVRPKVKNTVFEVPQRPIAQKLTATPRFFDHNI